MLEDKRIEELPVVLIRAVSEFALDHHNATVLVQGPEPEQILLIHLTILHRFDNRDVVRLEEGEEGALPGRDAAVVRRADEHHAVYRDHVLTAGFVEVAEVV